MSGDESIQSYRDLKVWNAAMDLAVDCHKATKLFPRDELFGLVSQIRRASSSVPANVAEGYGRDSAGSYVNHLRIAQGSLKELETHIILAGRVGLLGTETVERMLNNADQIGRMLRSLIRSVQSKSTEPRR
ncbi:MULTISPECIES: four helix bundle protein [Pleomorphomonadaceae]|uniref:four helix bundle protein n=1 Tax=Pleomorphomonadaceae TaxID=2843308 RepID=UPI0009496A50|nr:MULTISPECIES: four helix bundle protein [Pleomorphomonadaceae]